MFNFGGFQSNLIFRVGGVSEANKNPDRFLFMLCWITFSSLQSHTFIPGGQVAIFYHHHIRTGVTQGHDRLIELIIKSPPQTQKSFHVIQTIWRCWILTGLRMYNKMIISW